MHDAYFQTFGKKGLTTQHPLVNGRLLVIPIDKPGKKRTSHLKHIIPKVGRMPKNVWSGAHGKFIPPGRLPGISNRKIAADCILLQRQGSHFIRRHSGGLTAPADFSQADPLEKDRCSCLPFQPGFPAAPGLRHGRRHAPLRVPDQ